MPLGRGRVSFLDAALRKRRELIKERVIVAGFDLGGEILDLPDIGTTIRREAERPSGELIMNGIGKHGPPRVGLECQTRANAPYPRCPSAECIRRAFDLPAQVAGWHHRATSLRLAHRCGFITNHGGPDFGIVNTSRSRDRVSTKPGQLHGRYATRQRGSSNRYAPSRMNSISRSLVQDLRRAMSGSYSDELYQR